MIVMKFGGTSVADADAIRRVSTIVGGQPGHKVVVVSALAGITDALLRTAGQAGAGDLEAACASLAGIRERHLAVAAGLGVGAVATVMDAVEPIFTELGSLIRAVSLLREVSPRAMDAIAAAGELASSRLVAAALATGTVPAVWVDPRAVIVTNNDYTSAAPLFEETAISLDRVVAPLLARHKVVVTGGFVGATGDGVTTTLGRGGSDYSAAIVGACLGADEIQIWTDVDGMLTADPRIVDGPRPVTEISFDEAHELANLGAKVLHPATIEPAVKADIPVRVLNSRRPDAPGTLITGRPSADQATACALACRRPLTLVDVESRGTMRPHEFIGHVCRTLDQCQVPIALMTAAHARLTVAIDDERQVAVIVDRLKAVASVTSQTGMALLSLVSKQLVGDAAVFGEALGALEGLPVRMVSQLPSGRSVAIVVREEDVRDAMTRLHNRFFPDTAVQPTLLQTA
jgi:aspartate kinase